MSHLQQYTKIIKMLSKYKFNAICHGEFVDWYYWIL